jgi:hypothetical protein
MDVRIGLGRRLLTLAVLLWGAWLVSGCGMPIIKEATKQATAGALDQGIVSLEDAKTRQRVADLVASPEMQAAMRDIAAGFTNGVTGSLSNEETLRRLALLTNVLATTAARAAVDATLADVGSAENQRRMQEMAVGTATAATRAAMQEMSTQLAAMMMSLGPVLRTTLSEDVAPGMRDVLGSNDVRGALSGVAFEMARQAVLGSNQAMADLEKTRKKTGMIARIGGMFEGLSWLLPVLLAISVATIVILLARGRIRSRSEKKDVVEEEEPSPEPVPRARRHLLHRRSRSVGAHS